jgi:hypothetical protein
VHYSTPDCSSTNVCNKVKVEGGDDTLYEFRGGFEGPWSTT